MLITLFYVFLISYWVILHILNSKRLYLILINIEIEVNKISFIFLQRMLLGYANKNCHFTYLVQHYTNIDWVAADIIHIRFHIKGIRKL